MLAEALEKRKSYEQPSKSNPKYNTSSTSRPPPPPPPPYNPPVDTNALKQKKIEDQLEKMKREMGIK
jgi:hypothetical protein